MENKIQNFIKALNLNPPSSKELISRVESKFGIKFPKEYVEFMMCYNGAEGSIGNSYLVIWPIEEIVPSHEGYAVEEFAPGIVLFGSDGGGTAFAFDIRFRNTPIVEVPFIGMDISELTYCAETLNEFLEYLYNK